MILPHPREVDVLARIRFDREHGSGAWDTFMRHATSGVDSEEVKRVIRVCNEVIRRAEQDLEDLKTVLKFH